MLGLPSKAHRLCNGRGAWLVVSAYTPVVILLGAGRRGENINGSSREVEERGREMVVVGGGGGREERQQPGWRRRAGAGRGGRTGGPLREVGKCQACQDEVLLPVLLWDRCSPF